ncbi:MAG: SMP-30/gluconolactonase/LRE family protein [Phreatobacter sp.]
MRISKLDLAPALLGESPLWDPDLSTLFFVDTIGSVVRSFHPGSGVERSWPTPSWVGSIGLGRPGHLILALRDGFHGLELASGAIAPLWRPEPGDERVRFNDGKMDRSGRFLCGSMGLHAEPLGSLYRLRADGGADRLMEGIRIANTLCFSPAGDVMYFADSLSREILAFDYDVSGDRVGPPRVLIDTAALGSGPDGATVDAEGFLWVALVQTGQLARISPRGSVDRLIDLPLDLPSCPAFGGADLDILYLTSIKDSGTGRAVSRHPDGGSVLAIEGLGVRGLPEARLCPATASA